MLPIFCDGISRRSFLRIGGLGIGAGAFSLTDLGRLASEQNDQEGARVLLARALRTFASSGSSMSQNMLRSIRSRRSTRPI